MILLYLALLCDLAGIALMGILLAQEYSRPRRPRFVEAAGHRRPISSAAYLDYPLLVQALCGALRELEGGR